MLRSARGGLVVANVPQTDQRQRPGKPRRTPPVPRAKLTEDGDQGRIPQRVDLVQQDDEGAGRGHRPFGKGGADPRTGVGLRPT